MRFLHIYLILTTLGLFIIIGFTTAIAFGANSKANELSNSKADQLQLNTQVIRLQQNISSLESIQSSLNSNFEKLDYLRKLMAKDIEKETKRNDDLSKSVQNLEYDMGQVDHEIASKINAAKGTLRREMGELETSLRREIQKNA